jgi:glycosyltransferase involved in cell wall biosynthesis
LCKAVGTGQTAPRVTLLPRLAMKILSVNNTADIYGSSRCMERVFSRFAQDGHEVHAVLPKLGPLVQNLEAQGVRVHIHPRLAIVERAQFRSPLGILRFLVFYPVSVLWLAVLILRLRINLVHTNVSVMPTPAMAAFITGRTHVWHVRELLTEFGWLWRPYQRYMHMLSSAIIAISYCTRDQFSPRLRGKVQVIYDGLDDTAAITDPVRVKAFRETFAARGMLVGVVGRIKWHRKGQEVLVRAAQLLRPHHPNVHYVVVGSAAPGNEQHEVRLRELISSSGLNDTVTLTGDIQDSASIFAALDVAVVPSVQAEPFGCVVIEAMAAGTPVVGSRNGGIAEQIVDGVSGLLFSPGSAEELAEALHRFLTDAEFRQRTSEEGRRRVRDDFSLENTYLAMAALFDELAGPGPAVGVALQDSRL